MTCGFIASTQVRLGLFEQRCFELFSFLTFFVRIKLAISLVLLLLGSNRTKNFSERESEKVPTKKMFFMLFLGIDSG